MGYRLADLLVEQGRVDELRHRAKTGDWAAIDRLATLLILQGQVDEAAALLGPRANADAHDYLHNEKSVAVRLATLLFEHGRVEELSHRANGGDLYAADRLIELLAMQGRVDEATILLKGRTIGRWEAATRAGA
jgi:hypothetical protein